MRRQELWKLYTSETVVNPQTGRKKKVSRYIGRYYRLDEDARRSLLRTAWPCWGAAVAAFAIGGLLPAGAGYSVYVVVCYMSCLLPLFYLLLGALRISRAGENLTEIDLREGVNYVKGGSAALLILGGAWTLADVVFLLTGGAPHRPAADAAFLLCGAATAAMGALIRRRAAPIKAEEIKQEETTEQSEGERGNQP